MAFFLEIGNAHENIHRPDDYQLSPDIPNVANLIPLHSVEWGTSRTVQQKPTLTTVGHARTHDLVLTKTFDGTSADLLISTSIRKTKEIRIYMTGSSLPEGVISLGTLTGFADKTSTLHIKAIFTFGDAYLSSMHGIGSGSTGETILETIHINYSTLSVRNISGSAAASKGYDFKNAKAL